MNRKIKTKFVYVLTSNGNDLFIAMLELSLHTLLRYNPDADVSVVMDADTRMHLEKRKSKVLSSAIPVVVDIPSEFDVMQRSRYLKTTLRKNIQGDFLYLDGDTLIADRMDEIDDVKADLAMVADRNKPNLCACTDEQVELSRKANFRNPRGEPYFNGGVFLARDTPGNHKFFDLWHELWKESLGNGVPQDQPALCETNFRMGHPVKEISGVWNSQYRYFKNGSCRFFATKGKVFHYFTIGQGGRFFTFVLDRIQCKGRVDSVVAAAVRWPRLVVVLNLLSKMLWKAKTRLFAK